MLVLPFLLFWCANVSSELDLQNGPQVCIRPTIGPCKRPSIWPKTETFWNISDMNNIRVTKRRSSVVSLTTFQTMHVKMTLTLSQGHCLLENLEKSRFLLIFWSYVQHSLALWLHRSGYGKAFTEIYDMVTLTLANGQWMTLKIEKQVWQNLEKMDFQLFSIH